MRRHQPAPCRMSLEQNTRADVEEGRTVSAAGEELDVRTYWSHAMFA